MILEGKLVRVRLLAKFHNERGWEHEMYIEGRYSELYKTSWQDNCKDKLCLLYSIRILQSQGDAEESQIPRDDNVYVASLSGEKHLIHASEIIEVIEEFM